MKTENQTPYFVRLVLTSDCYKYPISKMVWSVNEEAAKEQAMKSLLHFDFWPDEDGFYDQSGNVHIGVSRVAELSAEQAAEFENFLN